jgi:hypothetical protein
MKKNELSLDERFKHLSEQYSVLESIHNDTVRQYNLLVERYDNLMLLTRRYSDTAEARIKELEERVENGKAHRGQQ